MEAHFTTGAFARLCGVSKHTLFHYDAMGVLAPAVKGENGYRYYAAGQIEVFHVISVLRELDMPLSEIRSYLDRRSPLEFVSLLEREDALLTEKLIRMRRLRDLVREKAELARAAAAAQPGLMAVEEQPPCFLVRTGVTSSTDPSAASLAVAEHVRYLAAHDILSPYAIGAMVDQEAVRRGAAEEGYTHYYTRLDHRPKGVPAYEKPAGSYLTVCHFGGWSTAGDAYRRMLDCAGGRGLLLDGPFFEDVLQDELSSEGYDNYMLKLSVLVRQK